MKTKIDKRAEIELNEEVMNNVCKAIGTLEYLSEASGKTSRGETYAAFASMLAEFLSSDKGEAGFNAYLANLSCKGVRS